MNWNFVLGVVAGSGLCAAVRWVTYLWSRKKKKASSNALDCFLFSPINLSASCLKKTASICGDISCPACNLRKFFILLQNTRTHLDVCVYLITSDDLTDILVDLSYRGIYIRVAVDKDMSDQAFHSKSFIFAKEHIPTKVIKKGEIMHNKFVIIDRKILVTGSFNWTRQAAYSNFENAVIVTNPRIVQKYLTYFEGIWTSG